MVQSTGRCTGDIIERTVYWWYNRNGRCIGDTIHRTAYWWYNRTDSVLVVQSTGLALVIQSYGLCIGDTIERTVYWWFNQLDDVCESGMGNPTVTSHITLSVVILTGTSSILSIIGAGIVFITFWRMPEIRNFTRWLLLYLTIADFFTAVFNLVGVGRYLAINHDDLNDVHRVSTDSGSYIMCTYAYIWESINDGITNTRLQTLGFLFCFILWYLMKKLTWLFPSMHTFWFTGTETRY